MLWTGAYCEMRTHYLSALGSLGHCATDTLLTGVWGLLLVLVATLESDPIILDTITESL